MLAKYSKEFLISPSCCDYSGKESLDNIFDLFIDTAGEHAVTLGIGARDLMKNSLFWVVAKARVHLYERPWFYDRVKVSTWPEAGAGYRCFRDYTIEKDGRLLVTGRHEWAIVNGKTKKPLNVGDILPDSVDYLTDRAIEEDFHHLKGEFPEKPFASYKVKSTDIDFEGHMNNVDYVRAFQSLYSSKEWSELGVYDMEISYASSCFEGEELLFSSRDTKEGMEVLAHLSDGKRIAYYTLRTKKGKENA